MFGRIICFVFMSLMLAGWVSGTLIPKEPWMKWLNIAIITPFLILMAHSFYVDYKIWGIKRRLGE